MKNYARHKTDYPGVWYIEGKALPDKKTKESTKTEKIYYIAYRKDGKLIEEKAGRQFEDRMTPARASQLRARKKSGDVDSNSEKRAKRISAKFANDNRWTFRKLLDEYLVSRPDLKGSANDVRRYKLYLEKDFGNMLPVEVSNFHIEKLRRRLAKKKLKPATIRHALEILRRLSNFGTKRNLCSGIPFVIEMPQVNNLKTEDLTPEQLDRLFQVLDDYPDIQATNMIRIALFTGMRRGEIFSLKWSDINFRRKIIKLREPKGGQDKTIPLNEMAEQVFATHPDNESDFVFPGREGKKRNNCNRPMKRIKEKAELPKDFRMFHGLRHVFASMLASSGEVDLYTLQTLLTHKSPLMTQRYAHLRDESLMQASNVIKGLMKPEKTVIDFDHQSRSA
jgi:integrase